LIATRPAGEPLIESVRLAVRQGLDRIYAHDRDRLLARTRLILQTPALRARQWKQQKETQHLIISALEARRGCDEDRFRLRVTAAACLAALTSALEQWVEDPETLELPDLIDRALTILSAEVR
jgi:hypothetical protein